MYSLNSYKEQVYNLGSPQPSPRRSPLKTLPKEDISEFVFPSPAVQTPVTPSRIAKRKCVSPQLSASPKKAKMMTPQQIQDMVTGLQSSMLDLTETVKNFPKRLMLRMINRTW